MCFCAHVHVCVCVIPGVVPDTTFTYCRTLQVESEEGSQILRQVVPLPFHIVQMLASFCVLPCISIDGLGISSALMKRIGWLKYFPLIC